MLSWGNRFNICCFLDNHQYQLKPHVYECMLAAGVKRSISLPAGDALHQVNKFASGNDWLFGHFSYDLKNEIEALYSAHPDYIGFPDVFFFVPEFIVILNESGLSIQAATASAARRIFREITSSAIPAQERHEAVVLESRFSREEYKEVIAKLKQHILAGDCYEVNFCQEFFSANQVIDVFHAYLMLSKISPNPFSAFYKLDEKYLLCASPERYLKKSGNTLISQPIKGTSKRNPQDAAEDNLNRKKLAESRKDRSENVMVVDLVRNDLSKVCVEGTVQVEELFGIYSFPQVHQMISTISGKLRPGVNWTEIVRATFPMGSMTGAPKKRVMELIEKYERTRRGIFSGAVGYRDPSGDFDFNVVIRSILYNQKNRYLSCQVGSGITFYSDADQEYEECLLKAEAIKKVLA